MPAAHLDLKFEQGATLEVSVLVQNPDKTPRDLTGYSTRKMQVRSKPASEAGSVLYDTYTTEITIPTPTNGIVVITIPDTKTAALSFDAAIYDCIISNGTKTLRVLEGNASVDPRVTVP